MIYMGFLFLNELDLLELRLEELGDTVDRFILVESTRTFTGRPKPLHYADNHQRFRKWWGKIHHLICTDSPSGPPRHVESHQRNHIGYGLHGCSPDDLFIVCDADEIVSRKAIMEFVRIMSQSERGKVVHFALRMFYLWMNCESPFVDCRTKGMTRQTLIDLGGAEKASRTNGVQINPAGWHFSYLGSTENVQKKLSSYCHTELNVPPYNTSDHIDRCKRDGVDLFGRNLPMNFVPVDDTFPSAVVNNPARWASYIHRD